MLTSGMKPRAMTLRAEGYWPLVLCRRPCDLVVGPFERHILRFPFMVILNTTFPLPVPEEGLLPNLPFLGKWNHSLSLLIVRSAPCLVRVRHFAGGNTGMELLPWRFTIASGFDLCTTVPRGKCSGRLMGHHDRD